MTNFKIRKPSETCKNEDISDGENSHSTQQMEEYLWKEGADNECLAGQINNTDYSNDTDDDDIVNDGETSTTFSLEECMNEFRARRIRRTSLSQYRQESEKCDIKNGKNYQETTELELINQNRSNKEQERKCKPCKNGFCYCFTSDSGDGGVNFNECKESLGLQARNPRRNRRSECNQNSKSKERCKGRDMHERKSLECETMTSCVEGTVKKQNQLTAISSLETSLKDAPLIHIIQELHENCVISKVKVNKHKILLSQNNTIFNEKNIQNVKQKKTQFKDQTKSNKINFNSKEFNTHFPEKHIPTAPTLENFSEMDSPEIPDELKLPKLEIRSKCLECNNRRRKVGGQLLEKRLSTSEFTYRPRNINKPPPKPPRSNPIYDDQWCKSSASTSASVREAERVVDAFLKKKGFKITSEADSSNNDGKPDSRSNIAKSSIKIESIKRKSYPLTSKNIKNETDTIISTYPTICDMKRVLESKTSPLYGTNIRTEAENVTKVTSIGWNEAKINDMLNCDVNSKQKKFQSSATQAQPQHGLRSDVIGNENTTGWQMPHKISLDTVDNIMCHNLASNVEDKHTPVKSKIISSSKKTKNASRKFLWSEQFKHLSPWSNKHHLNNANYSKSNVCSSSKAFIKSSKKKFLRLVSPKKENRDGCANVMKKTSHRTVGVQTASNHNSSRQLNIHTPYEHSSNQQSPPGSYHSPIQSSNIQSSSSTQSQNTTLNGTEPAMTHFDFSRTVHSPPKKAPRSSQRKLNFQFKRNDNLCTGLQRVNDKKTYRSFNSELDHDVSISKIGYILSNIRSKLEASDEQAARTFLETDRNVDHHLSGIDCSDSHQTKLLGERVELHENKQSSQRREDYFNDPIYSEIEDDSVHVSESPNSDNHTGIQHFVAVNNPEILYAKVNKINKQMSNENKFQKEEPKTQISLAKIMQDSIKCKKLLTNISLLPTVPEPTGSENGTCSSPVSLLHCQSLNNVRVMEHNSTPNKHPSHSKSDLSLHRSEIFLDNLCRSELVVDANIEQDNLEHVPNLLNRSYVSMTQPLPNNDINRSSDSDRHLLHNDTVSYELPNSYDDVDGVAEYIDVDNSITAGSNLGLSTIVPPSSHNQSTPKKQSFMTKDNLNSCELNVKVEKMNISDHLYNSCPNTPNHNSNDIHVVDRGHPLHSISMNEVSEYDCAKNRNVKAINVSTRYKSLKNVLQKSFRKSKTFIRTEGKRLSNSFLVPTNIAIKSPTLIRSNQPCEDSNANFDDLFNLNESVPVNQQIAQTVSICRRLPDLEISSEMVEAERLLLFSALRRENQITLSPTTIRSQTMDQKPKMRFFIDNMYLPVLSDVNQDIFFNYFYIVTFECGGIIKSTQSAECVNGTAIFRDCGIEYALCSELETNSSQESRNRKNAVKCKIFMLRLRKLSTISTEPRKRTIFESLTQSHSSTLTSTSSSSFNEVVSRFRLHASFTLDASDFVPYEYVHQESKHSDRICVRASSFCTLSLTPETKSTNLSDKVRLKGRAEVRFPKLVFAGFLNVEDLHSQHNWNRRWCTLNGIFLYVWQDENCLNLSPLLVLDLRDTKRNLNSAFTSSPRELCARPRSFCLECTVHKACADVCTAAVFFAAESQENLDNWLKYINIILDFIVTWL